MRLIKAEEILALHPCPEYSEDIIRANHGVEGITAQQIAELDIPTFDRFWVLIRLVPLDKLGLCAKEFVESVNATAATADAVVNTVVNATAATADAVVNTVVNANAAANAAANATADNAAPYVAAYAAARQKNIEITVKYVG